MGAISHIEDHYGTTVEPRILEQYRVDTLTAEQKQELGCDNRWQACLKAVIDRMQVAEDASFELANVLDFTTETPTGTRLDWLAGLVNVKRNPGENDSDFFTRFVGSLGNKTAGTPDNVIYNSAILSGDTKPQYMDEADCTFFVYTGPRPDGNGTADGGGHQLLRRQVKKLAPAGVLGLPGAAIMFCDGSLMGDQDGKLMMMVADDATVEHELVLGDETGNVISTPQGVPVKVMIKGGQTVPTIPVDIGGTTYDAVRIKDLPDASAEHNGYMVRDSEEGGTVKTDAITEQEFDTLWDNTPAESDDEEE